MLTKFKKLFHKGNYIPVDTNKIYNLLLHRETNVLALHSLNPASLRAFNSLFSIP